MFLSFVVVENLNLKNYFCMSSHNYYDFSLLLICFIFQVYFMCNSTADDSKEMINHMTENDIQCAIQYAICDSFEGRTVK